MLAADDIREGWSYRMKDGRIWRVVDLANFDGIACVQITDGKTDRWQFINEFLDNVAEKI